MRLIGVARQIHKLVISLTGPELDGIVTDAVRPNAFFEQQDFAFRAAATCVDRPLLY